MVQASLSLLAASTRRVLPRLQKAPLILTDAAVDRVKELLTLRQKVSIAASFGQSRTTPSVRSAHELCKWVAL